MNTQKMQLAVLALAMGLSGTAQADIFTNDIVANTPFAISVDTHLVNNNHFFTYNKQPLGQPNASDYIENNGINYQTILLSTNTVVTPPQIGGAGSADTYETYSLTYDIATTRHQTVGANALMVGGEIVEPYGQDDYVGAQTYLVTGQIENLIGTSLLNGGNGEIGFTLGANWDLFGAYAPGNLATDFTVSLKLGSSLGQLDTVAVFSNSDFSGGIQAAIDLGGNISLFDIPSIYWSSGLNFSGTTYFEAEFSVISGANLFPALYLGVDGAVYETSPVLVPYEETYTILATSEVIPALPVPEPETYAMMLAGLGLVGWAARRRKS